MGDFSSDIDLLRPLEMTLARRGYVVDQSWTEGPMSSGRMSMAGRVAHVRVTADRGQWFVELRPAAVRLKWFDLERWSACLGRPESFHVNDRRLETADVASALAASWRLQPQLSWLERHLDDIEGACAPQAQPGTLECLQRGDGRD